MTHLPPSGVGADGIEDDAARSSSSDAEAPATDTHPFASLFDEHRPAPTTTASAVADGIVGPARAEQQAPPTTRREARERAVQAERAQQQAAASASSSGAPSGRSESAAQPPIIPPLTPPGGGDGDRPRRKRRRWLTATIVTVVIVALIGGGGAYAWFTFQPQVKELLSFGHKQSDDYTGSGTGKVTITIKDGDIGSNIATTLQKAGVTKSYSAFYSLLLATKPDPVFQPGVYQLKKQMSAASALEALQDPKNKLTRTAQIPEGATEATILPLLAKATSIPLAQLQAAAANPTAFGLPAQAKNLDGYLFPATYTFNPGVSAQDVIKTLVDRAFQAFKADGVPTDQIWNTVILASIVQKESGPNPDDPGKIARVFTNRIAQGMPLQSDATVAYGSGDTSSVFTTDAQRADASDPYNTYVHMGLPVGPISNPGDEMIKAALNPTPGDWLYFVAVNLQTGETVFSNDYAGQQAAEQQLDQWCSDPANAQYCK